MPNSRGVPPTSRKGRTVGTDGAAAPTAAKLTERLGTRRPGIGTVLDAPIERPLKAYAFDPSQGRLLGNEMSMAVRYQELDPGPVVRDPSARDGIAVVDYDGATTTWYKPVDLDDPRILIRGGLDPSESDPRFHQQMVYAVVTETIQHFEAALGRRIHWRRAERDHAGPTEGGPTRTSTRSTSSRTRWCRPTRSTARRPTGSCSATSAPTPTIPGRNLPGPARLHLPVARHRRARDDARDHRRDPPLLHGADQPRRAGVPRGVRRPRRAVPALHAPGGAARHDPAHRRRALPASCSLAATDAARALAGARRPARSRPRGSPRRSAGAIRWSSSRSSSARRRGMNRGLRSALGTPPQPGRHPDGRSSRTQRGSILVAAVFDAYFTIYLRRTADLFRIYRAGGGNTSDRHARRRSPGCSPTKRAAPPSMFFTVCVRALDYCPPVDITFGDFLRAVVTADFDLHPGRRARRARRASCRRSACAASCPESASLLLRGRHRLAAGDRDLRPGRRVSTSAIRTG